MAGYLSDGYLGGYGVSTNVGVTVIQKQTATLTTQSTTVTMGSAPVAGHLLVMVVASNGGTDNLITTPTGWTAASHTTTFGVDLYMFYRVAGASEPATTAAVGYTTGSQSYYSTPIIVYELSGLITTTPLDVSASATTAGGATSLPSGTTATTTQADDYVIVAYGIGQVTNTITGYTSGYTQQDVVTESANSTTCVVAFHETASTGTQSCTATTTTVTYPSGATIAAFKASVSGTDVGNTLTYTATGLSPSTSYTIVVRAYDSGGVRGADSSPLSVTTTASDAVPITLGDAGAATDAISRTIATIPKTLADTGVGADAVSYTLTGGPTSKSFADASSAAVDFLSYAGGRSLPLADTGAGVDTLSRTITGGPPTQVPLADVAFPAVDALTHTGGTVTPPAPAPDFEKLEWIDPDGIAIPLTQRISGKGRWMPPVRIVRDQYAGLLGTRARQVTLDTASVLVPVLVTASTADDYRNLVRAMASSLNPLRGPGKLRATLVHADTSVTVREMAAYYTAGMDFPEDQLDVGYPSLLFNSEGPPYWTDAADTTITYTNNATAYTWFPLGGSPWVPLILNQSTIYAQATVVNDGDAPVYPVWSLTGPAAGVIQFDNQTTGKSLWCNYTLTSGQTAVVVDTRPGIKSITQGPVSLYRYLTAWDMWPLEHGRNDIALTVPGATAATQVQLTYRRGFLAA